MKRRELLGDITRYTKSINAQFTLKEDGVHTIMRLDDRRIAASHYIEIDETTARQITGQLGMK